MNDKNKLTMLANKHRLDFMSASDEDICNFAIAIGGESFISISEHVKQEAKKLVDSQPFQ